VDKTHNDMEFEELRDEGWRWGIPYTTEVRLPKYRKNLRVEKVAEQGGWIYYIYSYDTLVGTWIKNQPLKQLGYWSVTTQKHINYVAQYFGINTIITTDL